MILLKDGHTECNVAVKKKLNTFFEIIGIRKWLRSHWWFVRHK